MMDHEWVAFIRGPVGNVSRPTFGLQTTVCLPLKCLTRRVSLSTAMGGENRTESNLMKRNERRPKLWTIERPFETNRKRSILHIPWVVSRRLGSRTKGLSRQSHWGGVTRRTSYRQLCQNIDCKNPQRILKFLNKNHTNWFCQKRSKSDLSD